MLSRTGVTRVAVPLTLAATLAAPFRVAAQSEDARPTVGLVLSGGGARGFAHLGVLTVLHELRVPVDVVTGTSMGAVVGGMYATGIPAPELVETFRGEDWSEMFRDDPDRPLLPMRRKREDRRMTVGVEVGVGPAGLRLPSGLVGGARLGNALDAYLIHAREVRDFDALPIPFRAVATDATFGDPVVLGEGRLPTAIRASMSVPGAFFPVRRGERTLVDGGLVDNIPIDVARSLGADVVIVVDVSTGLDEAPEGEDALGLGLRLLTVVTSRSSRAQVEALGQGDVLLRPDLRGMSSADFSVLDRAVEAGETAARAAEPALRRYAMDEAAYGALVARRSAQLPRERRILADRVEVDGSLTRLSSGVVRAWTGLRAEEPMDRDEVRRRLTRLIGYGGFLAAAAELERRPPDSTLLVVRPVDKPWGPVVVRSGLGFQDRQNGSGRWSIRTRATHERLSGGGAQAWADLEIGSRRALAAGMHVPLRDSDVVFATLEGGISRTDLVAVVPELVAVSLDESAREVGVGLGARLGTWGEIAVQGDVGRYVADLGSAGEEGVVREDERSVSITVEADVLDRAHFPSRGHSVLLEYREAGAGGVSFRRALADLVLVTSVGHHTWTATALVSTGLGSTVPFHRTVPLGGMDRLTAAPRDAIREGYAVVGRLAWGYRIGMPAGAPGRGVRLGLSVEAGRAWTAEESVPLRLGSLNAGGSAWVGLGTPVGPVRAAYGVLDGLRSGWVLEVGIPY